MQNFFKEKSAPYFGSGGERHYALSLYLFPFLKLSSLTFVVQTNYGLSSKKFIKSYGMVMKFPKLF